MPDVVVVSGDLLPGSSTLRLARRVGKRLAALNRLKSPVVIDIAELAPMLLASGDKRVGQALADVQDATLLVIASPAYRGTYTGILKVFLDLLPPHAFAGVVAVPGGTADFQAEADAAEAFLARLLRELGADVVDFGLTATAAEQADLVTVADQYTAALTA